jgi:hypothetical protein
MKCFEQRQYQCPYQHRTCIQSNIDLVIGGNFDSCFTSIMMMVLTIISICLDSEFACIMFPTKLCGYIMFYIKKMFILLV